MSETLKSKTIYGLFWSFIESVGLLGVRLIIGIILARLLSPDQFGLIGMLSIFMGIAQTLLDSGFGAALIQKKEATKKDICSIFYFNIFVGLTIAGIIYLFAPLIASFYKQPILTPLTRAMSLIIIINSLGLIQGVILSKQINFKIQTKVSLIASCASGVIGIVFAAMGFGVWSLVVQQISSAAFKSALLWLLNSWRPALVFSLKSLKEMLSFGSKLLVSGILNQLFENIYFIVIGKLFSANELGFFARAKTFGELPSQTIAGMVGRVTFPVFSSIQDDLVRFKNGLKKALTTLVLINFPLMIGMMVIARPLVIVLLTEKWEGSIRYLQLLSVLGLLYPFHVINVNVLKAVGRTDLYLKLEILKKMLIIINIMITWRWGITAMIIGMICTSIISYLLNAYFTGRLVKYRIIEQIKDITPALGIAIITGILSYFIKYTRVSELNLLFFQVIAGFIIYFGLCYLLRISEFFDIMKIFRNYFLNKEKYNSYI